MTKKTSNTSWLRQYGILWTTGHMTCPECGRGDIKQSFGKASEDGAMRIRYKLCTACGCSWQTIELDADRYIDLLEAEKEAIKMNVLRQEVRAFLDNASDDAEGLARMLREFGRGGQHDTTGSTARRPAGRDQDRR